MATAHIETDGSPLAKALIKFQSELPAVTLDSENPHFKSKFTSLSHLTSVVIPKLAENGITFSATPNVTEHGFVMEAHLIHESGERLSASFPINETNPQKVGSAVTYFRRYALAALTGVVAGDDDDGNAASTPSAAERRVAAVTQPKAPTSPTKAPAGAKATIKSEYLDTGKVTTDHVNGIYNEAKASGLSGNAVWESVLESLKAGK